MYRCPQYCWQRSISQLFSDQRCIAYRKVQAELGLSVSAQAAMRVHALRRACGNTLARKIIVEIYSPVSLWSAPTLQISSDRCVRRTPPKRLKRRHGDQVGKIFYSPQAWTFFRTVSGVSSSAVLAVQQRFHGPDRPCPPYFDAAVQLTTGTFAELDRNPEAGRAEALQQAMIALMDDRSQSDNAHPAA